ncbi:hypothetical protein BJ741DRAFT_223512 [Chytriomyces cf. hyalinus JEL632]|nr:hypothetical protein BJ741DRAFT_223512 [Chytriomyces cf. hyalinus JEL632]
MTKVSGSQPGAFVTSKDAPPTVQVANEFGLSLTSMFGFMDSSFHQYLHFDLLDNNSVVRAPDLDTRSPLSCHEDDSLDCGSPPTTTRTTPPLTITTPASLRDAETRRRKKKQVYPCPYFDCTREFPTKARLTSHSVTHSGDRPFVCSVAGCAKAYTTNNRLTIHKRAHSNLRPYMCNQCEYAATQMCTLRSHLLTHLSDAEKREFKLKNARTVPCSHCGQLYKTQESLKKHQKQIHGN